MSDLLANLLHEIAVHEAGHTVVAMALRGCRECFTSAFMQ